MTGLLGSRPAVPLAMGFTVLAWASAFVVIRGVGPHISPGALTVGRLGSATVVLSVLLATRGWVRPTRREWLLLIGCGITWFAVYNLALNAAEQIIDAGTTAMLVGIGPLLIALLAGLFLGEGMPRWLFIGAGVSVAGIGIISFGGGTGEHTGTTGGVLLAVLAAVMYAIGVVLQKIALRRLPALQVTWTACAVGLLVCLPFLPALWREASAAPALSVVGICYLGVVPTALAFTTWAYALARTAAGPLGTTTYLVPVVVIAMAWVFLSEVPTGWQLAGGAVALLGVALSRVRSTRARPAPAVPAALPDGAAP